MTFNLVPLLLETYASYEENLLQLCNEINKAPINSIILTPEVCLTGFDYEYFESAAKFSSSVIEKILSLSENKIITLTLIEKETSCFYNNAYVINNKQILHKQAKHKLFKLGGESNYFCEGSRNDIKIINISGIKVAILICFELRFKELWHQLEGADIILIPAQWGKIRSQHFKILTKALAIMNECYVLASDAHNFDTTGLSCVVDPFGDVTYNNGLKAIYEPFDKTKIKKMRRYLDIGIK